MNVRSTIALACLGLACTGAHGGDATLWGITRVDARQMATLVTIDEDTGAATPVFQLFIPEGFAPFGLAYHDSGALYALATDGNNGFRLVVISPEGMVGDSAPLTGPAVGPGEARRPRVRPGARSAAPDARRDRRFSRRTSSPS